MFEQPSTLACPSHPLAHSYTTTFLLLRSYGFQKVLERILKVDYNIPKYPRVTAECKDLITRILVADPDKRLTIPQIQRHPWYSRGLPPNVVKMNDDCLRLKPHDHPGYQTIAEIRVRTTPHCSDATRLHASMLKHLQW